MWSKAIRSNPTQCDLRQFDQIQPNPTQCDLRQFDKIQTNPVRPDPTRFDSIRSKLFRFNLTQSKTIQSIPIYSQTMQYTNLFSIYIIISSLDADKRWPFYLQVWMLLLLNIRYHSCNIESSINTVSCIVWPSFV